MVKKLVLEGECNMKFLWGEWSMFILLEKLLYMVYDMFIDIYKIFVFIK